jgi:hypothetical protein
LRQKGISFHPIEAIQMSCVASVKLSIVVGHTHLRGKFEEVEFESPLKKWIVESVSVVARDDVGIVALDKLSESQQSIFFGALVEDRHMTSELRFGFVLELSHLLATEASVYDQEGFSFVH